MAKEEILCSLDIGTTKVAAIIAQLKEEGSIEVLGFGNASTSGGLRKGVIINLENTVGAIEEAVGQAEEMAEVKIKNVVVNVGGIYLKGVNNRGNKAITRSSKEISMNDTKAAIESSCEISIPLDQEIVFISPQEYVLDGQDGIKEPPVGIVGDNLGIKVHLFMGAITSMQNIFKSVNLSGLRVKTIVPAPLASSLSVLSDEEMENGVVLVDIGGGTTDVCVFLKGYIYHTHILGLGGEQITGDIGICLRSSKEVAERLKKEYGSAMATLAKEEQIEVPGLGGREGHRTSRSMLCEVIQARLEEILGLVNGQIKETKQEDMFSAGVVLTGGVSNTDGIVQLAEDMLKLPVRIGIPREFEFGTAMASLSDPSYGVGLGLLRHAKLKGYSVFAKTGFIDKAKRWWGNFF